MSQKRAFRSSSSSPAARGGGTILFLGKTGAGKTSLINALFGLRLYTDNAQAATREVQILSVELDDPADPAFRLTVIDVPGFAESEASEEAYQQLYARTVPAANRIVWVVQAHPRVFRPDQLALRGLRPLIPRDTKLTVALTHIDTIGPHDWDWLENRPSSGQAMSIAEQVDNVLGKLAPIYPLTANDVIPSAPPKGYGIDEIRQRIIEDG
jgi:predicted GTPase